ncbi:baseplate megatron protein TIM-barrel domain-containing protein [Sulfitobacter sp.]|jgi:hypothetical protein|uniref:baseplate megatron protein TIM-barrel domain-containing protein n=2 Tax=Sulfitobacter sp. TaxID=1903071 RepID=UPI0039E584C3
MTVGTDKRALREGAMPSTLAEHGLRSGASWIGSADATLQDQFLNELDEGELLALPFLFEFWAMPHQLPPEGDWRSWAILGGRGAGKTRAGAEWVRSQVEGARPLDAGRCRRVALVGETIEQVREVMIFGDSGILACSPADRRPDWEATRKRLVWPNGAVASVHTAHDPEGLRGPQFDAAWVDEYGCAAIDRATNQPNKFLDLKSSESRLPHHSTGARDELMQMQYVRAFTEHWSEPAHNPISAEYEGPMIDMSRAFVWAWDTRPYPFFPNNRGLWSDGQNYARGHWLNGRTSSQPLSALVAQICRRAGLTAFDTSALYGVVRGYAVDQVSDARASLQPLMLRYGFDAVERGGVLQFVMRDGLNPVRLDTTQLADSSDVSGGMAQTREAQAEIAGRVRLRFVQADGNFDTIAEEVVLAQDATHAVAASEFNMSLTRAEGRQAIERWLTEARVSRETLRVALPPSMLSVGAGDVIELPSDGEESNALYRIDRVEQGDLQVVDAVRIEPGVYAPAPFDDELAALKPFAAPVPVSALFMDLPLLRGDEVPHAPYIATTAKPWPGSVAVYSSGTDENYQLNKVLPICATMGVTETDLAASRPGLFDRGGVLQVRLTSGTLESVENAALLGGANLAAIGDGTADNWEVFQFSGAELVAPNTYLLTHRLRGQAGTDALMPPVWPVGSQFVLLNGVPSQLGLSPNLRRITQHYRIGPAQRGYDDPSYVHRSEAFDGNGLRPLSPCHLRSTAVAGGMTLAWTRRTRIDGDGWESMEVPLGEEAEQYLVRVSQNGQLIRETSTNVPSWHYADALRMADGVTGPVLLSVAQSSASYGVGPARHLVA